VQTRAVGKKQEKMGTVSYEVKREGGLGKGGGGKDVENRCSVLERGLRDRTWLPQRGGGKKGKSLPQRK